MQNLALREIRVDGPYRELYSYAATVRQPEFPVALQVDLRLVRKRRIKKRKKKPKKPPKQHIHMHVYTLSQVSASTIFCL